MLFGVHFLGFLFFATLLPAQSDFQWLQSLAGHQSPLATLSYNSAGGLLASGDESGQVFLWEGEAFTKATNWQAHEGKVSGIAFSPNGQWLATAGYDGKYGSGHCRNAAS